MILGGKKSAHLGFADRPRIMLFMVVIGWTWLGCVLHGVKGSQQASKVVIVPPAEPEDYLNVKSTDKSRKYSDLSEVGPEDEAGRSVNRIIGGKVAEHDEFPFVARLYENDWPICGAALISPNWMITAAHCVASQKGSPTEGSEDLFSLQSTYARVSRSRFLLTKHSSPGQPIKLTSASSLRAVMGRLDGSLASGGIKNKDASLPETGMVFDVKRVIVHPNFELSEIANDIALLSVEQAPSVKPANGNLKIRSQSATSAVRPIPVSFRKVNSDQLLTAIGWGATSLRPPTQEQIMLLRKVNLTAGPLSLCRSGIGSFRNHNGPMICTGWNDHQDTCFGDSGGPLFRWEDDPPQLKHSTRNALSQVVSSMSAKLSGYSDGVSDEEMQGQEADDPSPFLDIKPIFDSSFFSTTPGAGPSKGSQRSGGWRLVGITSFDINLKEPENPSCGVEGVLGYFTHAAHYLDFIIEHTHLNLSSLLYSQQPLLSLPPNPGSGTSLQQHSAQMASQATSLNLWICVLAVVFVEFIVLRISGI